MTQKQQIEFGAPLQSSGLAINQEVMGTMYNKDFQTLLRLRFWGFSTPIVAPDVVKFDADSLE